MCQTPALANIHFNPRIRVLLAALSSICGAGHKFFCYATLFWTDHFDLSVQTVNFSKVANPTAVLPVVFRTQFLFGPIIFHFRLGSCCVSRSIRFKNEANAQVSQRLHQLPDLEEMVA